jgi:hypothetical protein
VTEASDRDLGHDVDGGREQPIGLSFVLVVFYEHARANRADQQRVALSVRAATPMRDMWLGSIGSIVGRVTNLAGPYLPYVCGRTSGTRLPAGLSLHPTYFRLKRMLLSKR